MLIVLLKWNKKSNFQKLIEKSCSWSVKVQEETAQRVDVLEEKVSDLEKSTTIDSSQQYTLERIAKTTVISALGGIDSRAYQLMSRKLFSNIWKRL